MIKLPQFYLMGLLFIFVAGCQQTSSLVGEPKSWFGGGCTLPPPTNRQCFATASTPAQRAQSTVFMLAAGADTGKLVKTSSDIKNFSQAMQGYFKIPPAQICQLPNAFKAELETALQSLHEHLAQNDLVIIYFSGHGTFINDTSGDEKDGWDEMLVTYDTKCKKKVKDDDGLRDDYFVKLVNKLPTKHVMTVMDTCFSSGMALGSSHPNPLVANAQSKFLVKAGWGIPKLHSPAATKNTIKKEVGRLDSLKGLLLAAADEKQTALEIPEGGLFTVKFVEQLSQHADLKKAFIQTAQQVQEITQRSQFPQTPQAIGRCEILAMPLN